VASSPSINSLCHQVTSNGSDMETDKATSDVSKAKNAAVLPLKGQLSNMQALEEMKVTAIGSAATSNCNSVHSVDEVVRPQSKQIPFVGTLN
jgi:hypothetical protein